MVRDLGGIIFFLSMKKQIRSTEKMVRRMLSLCKGTIYS